jgi:hypothetical protein
MSSYFDPRVAGRGLGSSWEAQIRAAAADTGLSTALIKAVIAAESSWEPNAQNVGGGSYGLMQINAAAHGVTPAAALNPAWNISYGSRVLADQVNSRPSVQLALAAYNAGTSRTDSDLQTRINTNALRVRDYVYTVLEYQDWYVANDGGAPAPDLGSELPATGEGDPLGELGGGATAVPVALVIEPSWTDFQTGWPIGLAAAGVVVAGLLWWALQPAKT